MFRFIRLISLFAAFAFSVNADDDRKFESDIIVGKLFSFPSEILKAPQQYRVILPDGYGRNPTERYNVIYVLDGTPPLTRVAHTTMNANYGWGSLVPESIIIGVPSNNRIRDYTPVHSTLGPEGEEAKWLADSGGGEIYRNFLREEFFPHIEKLYRTNGHRTVIGHSLSGLFALSDLLSNDRLFQSYVAIDPSLWFADSDITKKIAELPDGGLSFAGSLYMSDALKGLRSSGTIPNDRIPRKKKLYSDFFDLIQQKKTEKLSAKIQHFDDETHGSVVLISSHEGLRHSFSGFTPPDTKLVAGNPSLIKDHYIAFSERAGATFLPGGREVFFAATYARSQKMNDNALALFQLNAENYPKSTSAWRPLAKQYELMGKKGEALEAYLHLLELAPDNQEAKAKVDLLSK